MEVGASPYAVHRNITAFANPEVWDPSRWEFDDKPEVFRTMKRHSLAFGAGPRMCIGMNVAVAEMKLLLARVYTMYETTLSTEWFLENGDVRPAQDRGELWPRENLLPSGKRAPIVFRRL
jgi:cytochrome P450